MAVLERDVGLTGGQRAIRRADDAAARCELLDAVGAPAGDARNGEHGRVAVSYTHLDVYKRQGL